MTYRAANEPSAVFTIMERAFSWLKGPSRGLLHNCENFRDGSFAAVVIYDVK